MELPIPSAPLVTTSEMAGEVNDWVRREEFGAKIDETDGNVDTKEGKWSVPDVAASQLATTMAGLALTPVWMLVLATGATGKMGRCSPELWRWPLPPQTRPMVM